MKNRTKFALISFLAVVISGIVVPEIPADMRRNVLATIAGVYLIAIGIYSASDNN